jgi:hypothetical protein
MRLVVAAFVLATAVAPVLAHHPFTPFYDASKPVSVTGVVVELRTINPHVTLVLDARLPDGRSGRWAFEGAPLHTFPRQGVKNLPERLRPGMRVTITGWPAKDPSARAFSGREITFADGSTMIFGPTPEEGDRWSCGSDPCSYRYPTLAAN